MHFTRRSESKQRRVHSWLLAVQVAIVVTPARPALSLAVVGADFPNKGKSPTRRFEIALCASGDPITLRPEPTNPADEYAVAVFSERDVQLGYLRSERAAWMFRVLHDGSPVVAVFQEATEYGCAIRVGFTSAAPTLPNAIDKPSAPDDSGFWPDPDWPD